MKRLSSFVLGAAVSLPCLFAQTSDIVVFSEEGDKFTLVIDGEAKNEVPASRVVAKGITNETPLLVINFADRQIPTLKQNGWMEPGMEYTLRITTNKKGAKVLRMQGQAPLGTAAAEPPAKARPAQFVEDGAAPATTHEVIATDHPTTRSTTTITTTEGVPSGQVTMNVDLTGTGFNMAVSDGIGGTTTTTTTTTYTTTTSGTVQPAEAAPAPTVVSAGCGTAMAAADFEDASESISSKGFDETKLTLAKQIAGSNCLSTAQVKAVMELFGFEDSKLDFAKFAYDHVSDRNNYYKVNDAFGFSGSVDALNSYIQGR